MQLLNPLKVFMCTLFFFTFAAGCVPTGKCTKEGEGGVFGDVCIDLGDDTGDSAVTDSDSADTDTGPDTDDSSVHTGETGDTDTGIVPPIDADGDGFNVDVDCDDTNAAINPDAAEVCDGVDNDCDSLVDDEDASIEGQPTWYPDYDGDGYGDPSLGMVSCEPAIGYVALGTDCNDGNADIHPYAPEACTDIEDMNCDGSVGYADADSDGVAACEGDCDDTNAAMFPGNPEICDGFDNDCDGSVDVGAEDEFTWYADSDGDSYGDPAAAISSCTPPSGDVLDNTDCDDTRSDVNPGEVEQCDGSSVDEDCNGLVNDADPGMDRSALYHIYHDADGDGYGDPATDTMLCESPDASWIGDSSDCDDTNAAVHPGAAEVCNGADDDCNGTVDDGLGTVYYEDRDGDGFGDDSTMTTSCTSPGREWITVGGDCNDTEPSAWTGATEVCDGVDNDCDGSVDVGAVDTITWYADSDSDGFGDVFSTLVSCAEPSGYTADDTDCDDANSAKNPDAVETCGGLDMNCDGVPGIGSDADTDGYTTCEDDCDDGDAGVNPGEAEVCNGVDDNCDGTVDEGVKTLFFRDADSDSFGDPAVSDEACSAPAGYVTDDTDCDDDRDYVSPAEAQECYSGLDEDCDGDVGFADSTCNSATSENLFTTGGSWNGETSPGVASTGGWRTLSGAAVTTNCTTANADQCSLSFTGPGSWSVTSDSAAAVATSYFMFSAVSSAASTTITYSVGSSGGRTYDATNLGWSHAVYSPFSQTSSGVVTLTLSITDSESVLVDSVVFQQ